MLDILEIARDDGRKQGMEKGLEKGFHKGMLSEAKDMVIEVLEEKIGVVPARIVQKVQEINTRATLKGLLRQAVRCDDIKHFEGKLALAVS